MFIIIIITVLMIFVITTMCIIINCFLVDGCLSVCLHQHELDKSSLSCIFVDSLIPDDWVFPLVAFALQCKSINRFFIVSELHKLQYVKNVIKYLSLQQAHLFFEV